MENSGSMSNVTDFLEYTENLDVLDKIQEKFYTRQNETLSNESSLSYCENVLVGYIERKKCVKEIMINSEAVSLVVKEGHKAAAGVSAELDKAVCSFKQLIAEPDELQKDIREMLDATPELQRAEDEINNEDDEKTEDDDRGSTPLGIYGNQG